MDGRPLSTPFGASQRQPDVQRLRGALPECTPGHQMEPRSEAGRWTCRTCTPPSRYFHVGLLNEADAALRSARQLNPENRLEPMEIAGAIHLFAGRTADAVGRLSHAYTLSDSRIIKYMLAWALYYEGEAPRAEAMLETMIGEEGAVPGNARATLAALLAARGATADARALIDRATWDPDLIHHGAYGLGTAYAQLGEPASAVRWLSQAATTGFPCYPWYARDPLLDPIRKDPGFQAFMRELRRSWEDARAKYAGSR